MSRYRPPQPRSARYITPEGAKRLREELQYLWKEERPKVTQAVSEAAALGDRSENAEYIYGKKRLREIDRRVRYLTRRLDELSVVDTLPEDRSRVYFGAWVTVEDEEGETATWRLVGPDEFDLEKGYLSIDAPMARALLGKRVDDEIRVATPQGQQLWYLVEIRYEG
ncbi:transcription elongation factor GreB [Mangrovitalea sediminis]|uniref:transcription elongation factor GreB n=1 Tax=Mangrovitalea sediminis TaxID=1982043 RepID=UPI000BE586CC|nr:transcription elongation factor GreB [Mangrovitalea sediminis]